MCFSLAHFEISPLHTVNNPAIHLVPAFSGTICARTAEFTQLDYGAQGQTELYLFQRPWEDQNQVAFC
jgi:hypothetical protein